MTTQLINKFLLKIQSTSDLITNSSSEVFICQLDDMPVKEFIKLVKAYHKGRQFDGNWDKWYKMSTKERQQFDWWSGDGGTLEFSTWEEAEDDWDKSFFHGLENPENYVVIHSDHAHYATNKWLVETLNAKELD